MTDFKRGQRVIYKGREAMFCEYKYIPIGRFAQIIIIDDRSIITVSPNSLKEKTL